MTDHAHELRRLAQAASHPMTKGRWIRLFGERTVYDRMDDGCRGIPVVATDYHPPSPFEAACLDFIAAANPAAVSEIIDRLEATEMNLRCCQSEREEAAALFLSVKNRLTDERDALRTELADLRSSMTFRTSLIGRIEAERDALQARIEAMERQEPIAWRRRSDYGWSYKAKPVNGLVLEPLYLAPGAQPAPSVPDGGKLVPTAESRHPGIYKMLGALHAVDNTPGASEWESYAAFLAAAPEP